MKAVVAAFNQEKALVGAFSVIVQPVVELIDRFTALPADPGDGVVAAQQQLHRVRCRVTSEDSKSSIRRFVITEKAPTRAFSWLKAATTTFTFKTLLRHYAIQALTPRSLNVKLGP